MLIGRLGQDPEVRYTQSNTAVATLNLATNERYRDSNGEYQDKTEWHRVVAWGRTAEVCQQYLSKGSMIYVEGPLQTREWEDKQGQKRYTTEVKALQMTMLDSRGVNVELCQKCHQLLIQTMLKAVEPLRVRELIKRLI